MAKEQMYARHLAELGFLEGFINSMKYSTQLLEASKEIPYHTLLVELEPDTKSRSRQMTFTFYPIGEEVKNTLLLQYFTELPFALNQDAIGAVSNLIATLNNNLVVGHLGINNEQNKLHHRYVQCLPDDSPLPEKTVVEVFTLFSYTTLLFGEILEKTAQGELTVEDAKTQIAKLI